MGAFPVPPASYPLCCPWPWGSWIHNQEATRLWLLEPGTGQPAPTPISPVLLFYTLGMLKPTIGILMLAQSCTFRQTVARQCTLLHACITLGILLPSSFPLFHPFFPPSFSSFFPLLLPQAFKVLLCVALCAEHWVSNKRDQFLPTWS